MERHFRGINVFVSDGLFNCAIYQYCSDTSGAIEEEEEEFVAFSNTPVGLLLFEFEYIRVQSKI